MKCGFFSTLLFSLCFLNMAQAEDRAGVHLNLNRPPPTVGEEWERTIQVYSMTRSTNVATARTITTNSFHFFEMQGRENILVWDVSNDYSKVELMVKHLVEANGHQTNELVRPGTRIIGTSILGESFFEPKNGTLPESAEEQLRRFCPIRPRDFNLFARTRLPPRLSVGQTYELPPPPNVINALKNPQLASILGASFTNDVKATGQLLGTTHLFGCNCFHLRIHLTYSGIPGFLQQIFAAGPPTKIKFRIALTVDLFVPFDPSQQILMENYRMRISSTGNMTIRGKAVKFSRGQSTLKIVSVSRPWPPPE